MARKEKVEYDESFSSRISYLGDFRVGCLRRRILWSVTILVSATTQGTASAQVAKCGIVEVSSSSDAKYANQYLLKPGQNTTRSLSTRRGLGIENVGTDKVYISHKGHAIFSFGASDDVRLGRPRNGNLDIIAWADWQQAHGMNHLRDVMVQSFGFLNIWADQSGDSPVYHFVQTQDGRFDLDHFD